MTVFRILGRLEVRENAQMLDVGGRKQRALLTVLLLRAGETVSVDQLIDALWGDRPPARAVSSVHAYVSRLRKALGRDRIIRSDYGYRLVLERDELDLRRFERLLAQGRELLQQRDAAQASETLRSALGLWQGPPLADFMYEPFAAAEVRRLEELRLAALEERLEADLALGHHAELVPELDALVRANPLRERLVAQLMVALYRAGRQAEALDVYERTRRALGHELGLQPSHELQRLSAEIVRQEPSLDRLSAASVAPPVARTAARRLAAFALLALAVAAAIAVTVVFVRAGGGGSATAASRLALVLPRPPGPRPDPFVAPFVDGLQLAASEYRFQTKWLVGDELPPWNSPANAKVAAQLQAGNFDLIVVAGETLAAALVPTVRKLGSSQFVFVDTSLHRVFRGAKPFRGLRNATGVPFADGQAGYLVGYLSGLMEARRGTRLNRPHVVSVIGGWRDVPPVEHLVHGFARGARRALPGIIVLTDYSQSFVDQSKCEALANRQIDDGSDIVFAAAGTCSLGALRAAGIRGVWGVGVDGDRSYLGPHILASTVKRYDQALLLVARSFRQGTLPGGRDVVLGLNDDAVGIAIGPDVPASIRKSVARVEVALRKDARR